MGKLVAFKRIAVTPLPTPPAVVPKLKLPTQKEVDAMTAEQAYEAGQKLGEQIRKNQEALEASQAEAAATRLLSDATKPYRTITKIGTVNIPVAPSYVVVPVPGSKSMVTPSNAVTAATTKVTDGAVLWKESDTGIGFKRWAVWIAYTNRWTVHTEWGHEAHKQARKEMSFLSESRARLYMGSCIVAKVKRGYRRNK